MGIFQFILTQQTVLTVQLADSFRFGKCLRNLNVKRTCQYFDKHIRTHIIYSNSHEIQFHFFASLNSLQNSLKHEEKHQNISISIQFSHKFQPKIHSIQWRRIQIRQIKFLNQHTYHTCINFIVTHFDIFRLQHTNTHSHLHRYRYRYDMDHIYWL